MVTLICFCTLCFYHPVWHAPWAHAWQDPVRGGGIVERGGRGPFRSLRARLSASFWSCLNSAARRRTNGSASCCWTALKSAHVSTFDYKFRLIGFELMIQVDWQNCFPCFPSEAPLVLRFPSPFSLSCRHLL